jgi:hypothetical protein
VYCSTLLLKSVLLNATAQRYSTLHCSLHCTQRCTALLNKFVATPLRY